MKIEKANELVRYEFTTEEKLDLGKELATKGYEAAQQKEEAASVAADYKSDIKKTELAASETASKIRDGFEMRRLECLEIKDYGSGMVYWYRRDELPQDMDVGDFQGKDIQVFENYLYDVFGDDQPEPVKHRKMRDEERQSGLFEESNEGEGEEVDKDQEATE